MYSRYLVNAYFEDELIYKKRFKSLTNAVKVCCGFSHEIFIEIEDLVLDKVITDYEVKEFVHEFTNDYEEDY